MGLWTWRLSARRTEAIVCCLMAILSIAAVPLLYYRFVYYQTNLANVLWAELPVFITTEEFHAYYIPFYLLALFFVFLTVTYHAGNQDVKPMKRFKYLGCQAIVTILIVGSVYHFWMKDENFHHDVCRILVGDTSHEIWYNIVWKSRLPQVLTAIVAGAGLAVSGLQMQTVFRNPLAGPSVLGISNGSALGVAFVVLLSGRLGGVALSRLGYLGEAAMSVAAIVGALSVMLLIMWIAQRVKGNVTLLIIGVMIGYLANAIIGVLKFLSPEEDVKAFVVWGLGSFSRVSGDEMVLFVVLMAILIPLSFLLVKSMNLLLLGDKYAANLGLNIRRSRMLVILSSGILVAIVTAYCGPIMFIGLAVPHLARAIFRSSDHRILMPATALCGAVLALLCNFIARMPGFEGALPVNSVTALVGAPIKFLLIITIGVLFLQFKTEVVALLLSQ